MHTLVRPAVLRQLTPATTLTEIYFLLRSRAVLEFNGKGWFGVHPLVVDILADQGRIERDATGKVPGGSE